MPEAWCFRRLFSSGGFLPYRDSTVFPPACFSPFRKQVLCDSVVLCFRLRCAVSDSGFIRPPRPPLKWLRHHPPTPPRATSKKSTFLNRKRSIFAKNAKIERIRPRHDVESIDLDERIFVPPSESSVSALGAKLAVCLSTISPWKRHHWT